MLLFLTLSTSSKSSAGSTWARHCSWHCSSQLSRTRCSGGRSTGSHDDRDGRNHPCSAALAQGHQSERRDTFTVLPRDRRCPDRVGSRRLAGADDRQQRAAGTRDTVRRPGTPTDGVSINDLNCGLSPRAARKLPRIVLILLRNRVHVLRYSGSPASHTNIRSAPLRGRLDPQFPS